MKNRAVILAALPLLASGYVTAACGASHRAQPKPTTKTQHIWVIQATTAWSGN